MSKVLRGTLFLISMIYGIIALSLGIEALLFWRINLAEVFIIIDHIIIVALIIWLMVIDGKGKTQGRFHKKEDGTLNPYDVYCNNCKTDLPFHRQRYCHNCGKQMVYFRD